MVQGYSSRELAKAAYERIDDPEEALEVVLNDPLAGYRQAIVVPREGEVQSFTGVGTLPAKGFVKRRLGELELYCIGNGLANAKVLTSSCSTSSNDVLKAVFEVARVAEAYGGNRPGSKSAALVYLGNFSFFEEVLKSESPVHRLWAELVAPTPLY